MGDNFPYPFEAFSGWFCAYFTEEVSKGFQDIYDDVENTRQEMITAPLEKYPIETKSYRESFASIWRHIATTFGGLEGVFGYELLNEPWAGDVVADLSLMLPGVAGRRNLAPAWEKVRRGTAGLWISLSNVNQFMLRLQRVNEKSDMESK